MSLIHLKFLAFFFLFFESELTVVCDCRVGMSSANNLDENLTCIWLENHKKRDKNNHIDHKKPTVSREKYFSPIDHIKLFPVTLPLPPGEHQEFNKRWVTTSRQHANGLHLMQDNSHLCLWGTRLKYHFHKNWFCFHFHQDESKAKITLLLMWRTNIWFSFEPQAGFREKAAPCDCCWRCRQQRLTCFCDLLPLPLIASLGQHWS